MAIQPIGITPDRITRNEEPLGVLVAVGAGLVNHEAHDLTLLDVVETNNADEGVGVFAAAFANFTQNFLGSGAVEHGQLPHRPVRHLGSRNFREFDAGMEPLIDHVLDLLHDLRIGQRRQIGQRFVTTLNRESSH